MTKILPKSKKLLKRVEMRLKDKEFTDKMLERIIKEIITFYVTTPRDKFARLVIAKMTDGAKTHGEPNYSQDRIRYEKIQEMIDIVGWDFTGEKLDKA